MDETCIDGKPLYEWMKKLDYCRAAGTAGERTAAEQIADQIRCIGETPYIEPFSFVTEKFSAASLFSDGKKYNITGIPGTCPLNDTVNLKAPVYYAENGDPVSLKDVAGKIIIINGPVTECLYNNAAAAGAAAFLLICGTPHDSEENEIPKRKKLRFTGTQKMPGACIHYLDALELLQSRDQPEAELILCDREEMIFSQNIAARVTGTKWPNEIITLTAHYDSVSEGPGAYDNLASCAIIMELLKYFLHNRPGRTLEFIWFGSEEEGLRGSLAYVRKHEKELAGHLCNLNSDLAGQLIGGDVIGITGEKRVCDVLDGILSKAGFGVTLKNMVWSGDSNSFAYMGIPAMTYDRDGFGMHTVYDTMEWISPIALKKGTRVIGTIAEELSDAEHFPFDREIPEDMKKELEEYFHKSHTAV